jgi:hypothetical protein
MDLTTLANYLHENSLIDEEDYFEKVSFSLLCSLLLCCAVLRCAALVRCSACNSKDQHRCCCELVRSVVQSTCVEL